MSRPLITPQHIYVHKHHLFIKVKSINYARMFDSWRRWRSSSFVLPQRSCFRKFPSGTWFMYAHPRPKAKRSLPINRDMKTENEVFMTLTTASASEKAVKYSCNKIQKVLKMGFEFLNNSSFISRLRLKIFSSFSMSKVFFYNYHSNNFHSYRWEKWKDSYILMSLITVIYKMNQVKRDDFVIVFFFLHKNSFREMFTRAFMSDNFDFYARHFYFFMFQSQDIFKLWCEIIVSQYSNSTFEMPCSKQDRNGGRS